jgi:trk system potassium uptake protein TrkA
MKRFAVIGLGRFGKKLAIALAMSGAEVIAIDKNREQH